MAEHALLSASKSGLWLACTASIAASQGIPDSASDSARWGTAAHELAAWCLEPLAKTGAAEDPARFRGRIITVDGKPYPVDARMIEAVQTYVAGVNALYRPGDIVLVEYRVDYSRVIGVDNSFGTVDVALVRPAEKLLICGDLKTGQRLVKAAGNTQLGLYLLALLDEFELLYEFDRVQRVIFQPPKGPEPLVWESSVEDLRAFGEYAAKRGQAAYDLIPVQDLSALAEHMTAGEHCHDYYCRRRATCPKARAEVLTEVFVSPPASADEFAALDVESPNVDSLQHAYIAEDGYGADIDDWLAAALGKVDFIEKWCSEVRAECYRRAELGTPPPGFKLVAGKKGARSWTDAAAAEELLKSMRLKVDEMYDSKLKSPAQIEKALAGSERRWAKVQALIQQTEGKPTLVPETDKREALGGVADGFDVLPSANSCDDLI